MSENYTIPMPMSNYLHLIKRKRSPYYDLICYIIADMEKNYKKTHPHNSIIYTVNPRRLREEIEDKIPNKKLTTINISRTLLALFYGSKLQKGEDYYVTTSSGGRKNYHIKVNSGILSALRMHL